MISFLNSEASEKYPCLAERITQRYDGCECDFALSHGTLIARIFDDSVGYMLTFPEPVETEYNVEEALAEITNYCTVQQIPEVITDVPSDELGTLLRGVRHAELHAMDERGETFIAEIKNELSMLRGDIDFSYDGICLSTPSQDYAEAYAALVRDREHNRYYGYEITDDMPNATAAEMVAEARRELELCRALTLFVSEDGRFMGEGVLYNFDGRGGAELSFRVRRDECGKGYGRKILRALISLSEDIGLLRLLARVHRDNAPSLSLLSTEGFLAVRELDELVFFEKSLV